MSNLNPDFHHPIEASKFLDFFKFSFDYIQEPEGFFFFFCILIGITVAVFTWPKKHVKGFFIYSPMLFVTITLFFRRANQHVLLESFLHLWLFEIISYSFIFSIFYWISVGITSLCSNLTLNKKLVLSISISILLWLFAKVWYSLVSYLAILIIWRE